ncbi:MAG TPA: sulfatase [Planctomycetota bacterium]|jgi:arylsulfatase A-like enzyme
MNVLLIAIDTLRAMNLGCYGYARPTSPNIDRLASQGVLCTRMLAPGIPTHPSFTTLFTGQHPIRHGVVAQGGTQLLSDDTPTLPQLFLEKGYATASFDNLPSGKPYFARGFEMQIDSSKRRGCGLMVTCEEINARLLPFLKSSCESGEPFFAFVHYWDPHTPYWASPRYRSLFYEGDPFDPTKSLEPLYKHPLGKQWRETWFNRVLEDTGRDAKAAITDPDYVAALYDQEIRCVDDGVGVALEVLDETKLAENTLVLLLADHGESMTEHGIYFDHHGLYSETLHVPLIARLPSQLPAGRRVDALIQHSDVLPTLCEAAGLKKPENLDGRTAWGLLTGQRADEALATRLVSAECSWQKKWLLRDEHYHFIQALEADWYGNPLRELYDLRNDPRQRRNIAEEQPEIVRELERELAGWISDRLTACGRSVDPIAETKITMLTGSASNGSMGTNRKD